MGSKAKSREKDSSFVFTSILKAVAIGLAASSVLLLLFSFVLSKKDIPFALINPFSAGLIITAAFLSGYTAAKAIKQRGMLVGAACGAAVFFVLIIASFWSSFNVGSTALIKLAISLISGAIGGILGVNAKSKRK